MITLSCTFDPVTEKEVRYILSCRKEKGIRDLAVCVSGEGILSREERTRLLKLAFAPYRHVHVTDACDDAETIEAMDEEAVRSGMFRLAAKGTRRVLMERGFYHVETARAMCKERRYVHSGGVAGVCKALAKAHGLDEMKAWRAGWLHDITKAFSDEKSEEIIARWKPEWLNISPKVWHSYTAVIWLKQNMGLYDHDILNALEHHTLGDGKSAYAWILYIADKIEPGRGYDASKEMAMAEKDLKTAAAYVLEESKAYIYEKEGIHV